MSETRTRYADLPVEPLEPRALRAETNPRALPPLPDFATVLREQLGTVGLSLRREMMALGALLGFVTLTIVSMWLRSRGGSVDFEPEALLPVALVGFFAPLAVWKSEGPGRRGYHHAMPVDHSSHALAKVFSGWAWYLAAAGTYAAWLLAMASMTGGRPFYRDLNDPWWTYLAPLVGGTVLYAAVSALSLATRQPWRWLAGGAVAWVMIRVMGEAMPAMEPLGDLVEALWDSVLSMVSGKPQHRGYDFYRWGPSLTGWLSETLAWATASFTALFFAARKQPEA